MTLCLKCLKGETIACASLARCILFEYVGGAGFDPENGGVGVKGGVAG